MATRQSARLRAASKPPPSPRDATVLPLGQASPAAAIFLTNLRLLDLHLLPDWPSISLHTFSAAGAGVHGQKRRIQSAEWALFHLFNLWHPQDAASKLKPFFPPLDQIQSISLRAALLRALEQAKKNGVLGRDALVRKTILDECKGKRLEEILAALSTAVLKKQIASESKSDTHHAVKLALDNNATPQLTHHLSALVLAHKASLRRFLQQKALMRSRYTQFAGLLRDSNSQHHGQSAILQAAKQSCTTEALSSTAKEEMHRILRHNWTGDEGWIKALMHGDQGSSRTSTLLLPFEKVWQEVERGRLTQLQQGECGLLEQLEARAAAQQQRLDKLSLLCSNQPHSEPSSMADSPQQPSTTPKGKGLDFGQHLNLQIGADTAYASKNAQKQPMLQADEQLHHQLCSELARIKNRGAELPEFLARHEPRYANHHDDAASTPHEPTPKDQDAPLCSPHLTDTTLGKSSANATLQPGNHQDFAETDALGPVPSAVKPHEKALVDCSNSTRHVDSGLTRKSRANVVLHDEENASQRALPEQETIGQSAQHMSDDAIPPSMQQSVSSRQSLSLAQRTRLSMSQTNHFPQQEAHQPQSSSSQQDINEEAQEQALPDAKPTSTEDLLSRTRRSMAGSEKAKQKAQLERRNSLRRSRLPPRVESAVCATVDEAMEQSTLAEELMLQEDMEAVFRSRPKIKASPVASPTKKYAHD
ncbi:hypothetical protein CDD81_537 [Ophiocordyceps australis]|uniref:HAUS augmin-like complex subunit 6 N-terminal domain-containing protein n=1 Tax=Ophiocordyceps australis TaxID=1399860 RepID=A0A2C5YFE5_9HYPO|nr:hypothetical protein CDD81_537 [Ophiocordyceps australis]